VEGQKLDEFLRDLSRTEQDQKEKLNQVDAILLLMEQYRITHGDLKPANVIITADGPVLIDLDSVKVHRTGLFFGRDQAKDIERLSSLPGV
jgi:tRNA A-37 threonylcarbamoyl transferase component Bud32